MDALWCWLVQVIILLLSSIITESEALELTVIKALTEGGRFGATKVCGVLLTSPVLSSFSLLEIEYEYKLRLDIS